jgi:hypothetical protein
MARTRINLSLYAGDVNEQTLQVLRDGDPVDLTGATVTAQARRTPNDPVVALTAVVTMVEPAKGILTVAWDGNTVRALLGDDASWIGVWDLDVLPAGSSDGSSVTVADGAVTANMDVTRAPDVTVLPVPEEPTPPPGPTLPIENPVHTDPVEDPKPTPKRRKRKAD